MMLFAYFAGLISYDQLVREIDIFTLPVDAQQAIIDRERMHAK